MIRMDSTSEVIGIWYVDSKGGNLLMSLVHDGDRILATMRVRVYQGENEPEDRFIERDGSLPLANKERAIALYDAAAFDFKNTFESGSSVYRFFGGTGKEAVAWMRQYEWAHVKEVRSAGPDDGHEPVHQADHEEAGVAPEGGPDGARGRG